MELKRMCGICKTGYKDLREKILCEMECMKQLQWKIEGDERSCTTCCEDLEVLVARRKDLDDQIQKIKFWINNLQESVNHARNKRLEFIREHTKDKEPEDDWWIVYHVAMYADLPNTGPEEEDREEHNDALDKIVRDKFPKNNVVYKQPWTFINFKHYTTKEYDQYTLGNKNAKIRILKPTLENRYYLICCEVSLLNVVKAND